MDRHAGYAGSIAIQQQMMQDIVRVLYIGGKLSHTISVSEANFAANLHLSLPVLTFEAANDNRVALDLYAWGPITILRQVGKPEYRKVKLRAKMLIPLSTPVVDGGVEIVPDVAGAEVTDVEIDPYSGGLFSPDVVDLILSREFQASFASELRQQFTSFGELLPPLKVDFLGAIASDPTASVTTRVLDRALVFGIDVDTPDGRTHGRRDELTDTTEENSVGIWLNPAVIPQAYPDVRATADETVRAYEATLDRFDMRVEEGWFRVSGRASKTGGAINFSLRAVPKLFRPPVLHEFDDEYGEHFVFVIRVARDELWFDPQHITVDVDREWWAWALEALVGFLTGGFGVLIVEGLVYSFRRSVAAGIDEDGEGLADRTQEFEIPGASGHNALLWIKTYQCHAEGVYAGITYTPIFRRADIRGTWRIAVEEALVQVLRFEISLPGDQFIDDPELRVRWTLRRTDTNAVLDTRDHEAIVGLYYSFDALTAPFLEVSRLSLEWRVYRTLGAGVEDVYVGRGYIDITDYVDRSHPYVRWDHEVFRPVVRVEADGTQTVLGRDVVVRHSAIHRTAIPGRCRMLRRHSLRRRLHPERGEYRLIPLDELPFPPDQIIQNRAQLCDYCFFGGPDKDVPLV